MSRITLTIDNGPHPEVTPQVLQVLKRHQLRAHFFIVGAMANRAGGLELLDRIAADGHKLGNHTWSHRIPFGENDAPGAISEEVVRTTRLLAPYLDTPRLFRPFGGGGRLDPCLFSPALIAHLCAQKYTCALWNNVPGDWLDMDGWVATALENVQSVDWSVIVVHDNLPGNASHIDEFITAARNAGHEFVDDISPDCLPIVNGEVLHDLTGLTTL